VVLGASTLEDQALSPVAEKLKDERRTSNVQRPTSNEKQTANGAQMSAISLALQLTFYVRCSTFVFYSMLNLGASPAGIHL